jgi:hypothetical protein
MINKKHQFIIIAAIVLLFAGVTISNIQNAVAQSPPLTGKWRGTNDGSIYYIRQVGNKIFWIGFSGKDDGKWWSNVFTGTVQPGSKTIVGNWADVPRGTAPLGVGTLTLAIENSFRFHKFSTTGSFFGTNQWVKLGF